MGAKQWEPRHNGSHVDARREARTVPPISTSGGKDGRPVSLLLLGEPDGFVPLICFDMHTEETFVVVGEPL